MRERAVPSPLLGEPLPVELANTVFMQHGQRTDALATREGLATWLAANRARLATPADHADAERHEEFLELRDALRSLFTAAVAGQPPAPDAVHTLNRLSARGPAYPTLRWSAAAPPQVTAGSSAPDPAAAVLAELARAAIELLGGPARKTLRACPAPGCVLFFVKDHPRREWCSNTCGNRVRVARHYRRQQQRRTPVASSTRSSEPAEGGLAP